MSNRKERGNINRASIISLFVVVLGVFIFVKYHRSDKTLASLQHAAQRSFEKTKQETSSELRDILLNAQKTERRLNHSFDSYRQKLLEMDDNNKAVQEEWQKQFSGFIEKLSGLMEDHEERIILKEQKLDSIIAAYESKLENLGKLPDTILVRDPDIEELQKSGDLLSDLRRYQAGIDRYKQAVELLDQEEAKDPDKKKALFSLYLQISENYLNIYLQDNDESPDIESLEQARKYTTFAISEDNAQAHYLMARILNEYGDEPDDLIDSLAKALDNNGVTVEMVLKDFANMKKDEQFEEFIKAYRKGIDD